MCKVFAMSNMKNVNINKKFIKIVKNEVNRSGDKHGFGYAVLSDKGEIAGERTLKPETFQPLQPCSTTTRTGSLPIVQKTRNQFGKLNFNKAKSFIGHGRYSTNTVSLENTHPFINKDVAMIHNGVVYDPDSTIPKTALKTDNDTELLLRSWEAGGLKAIEKNITGYYAMAILDKSGLLHIVRDATAPLYIAYCRTVDSFMIATTSEIIKNVAKKMQWSVETPEEILENVHVIFDRNEIMSQIDFEPRKSYRTGGYTAQELAAFGTGSSRGYSGHSSYKGYQGNGVFDATSASASNGIDGFYGQVDPEDEEVPSYREDALAAGKENEAFGDDIMQEAIDRDLVDQMADVDYNNLEGYVDETNGYESAYQDVTGKHYG